MNLQTVNETLETLISALNRNNSVFRTTLGELEYVPMEMDVKAVEPLTSPTGLMSNIFLRLEELDKEIGMNRKLVEHLNTFVYKEENLEWDCSVKANN